MANKKKNIKELNVVIDELMERVKVLEENAKTCKCNNDEELIGKAEQSKEDNSMCEEMFRQVNEKIEDLAKTLKNSESDECKRCDTTFKGKRKQEEHVENNHRKKNICNDCDKRFSVSCEFEAHLKEHGEQKNFQCNVTKLFIQNGD